MPHSDIAIVHLDESCLGNGREGDNPGGAGGLIEAPSLAIMNGSNPDTPPLLGQRIRIVVAG